MFKKKIVVRRKRNSSSKSSFWAGFFTGKKSSRKKIKVVKKSYVSYFERAKKRLAGGITIGTKFRKNSFGEKEIFGYKTGKGLIRFDYNKNKYGTGKGGMGSTGIIGLYRAGTYGSKFRRSSKKMFWDLK